MRKYNQNLAAPDGSNLFDRVISILERARTDSLRAVNNNMVIAYWLIGREIVLEIQGGNERAEYRVVSLQDSCIRSWMFLAPTQGLSICLYSEEQNGFLVEEA